MKVNEQMLVYSNFVSRYSFDIFNNQINSGSFFLKKKGVAMRENIHYLATCRRFSIRLQQYLTKLGPVY